MTKLEWDVSDIDPTTMFPKDCRYYNGGFIAPPEITQFWEEEESDANKPRKTSKSKGLKPIIAIDRLERR